MYKDENAKLNRRELLTLFSNIDFCLTKSAWDETKIETKLQLNFKEWYLYKKRLNSCLMGKGICSVKSYK